MEKKKLKILPKIRLRLFHFLFPKEHKILLDLIQDLPIEKFNKIKNYLN